MDERANVKKSFKNNRRTWENSFITSEDPSIILNPKVTKRRFD